MQPAASQSLATIQSALRAASPDTQEAASDAVAVTSQALGTAVEAAAPKATAAPIAAARGVIQLRVTDPPPPDADAVLIQVTKIEAHPAGSPGGTWITLSDEPQTFDLLRVVELPKFLGEQQVNAGSYTKIRFDISSAIIVVKGVEYQVKVPSDSIYVTRPFVVQEGNATVVVLDFNGSRTLRQTSDNQFELTPRV